MWPVPKVVNVSILPSAVPGTFRDLSVFPDVLATKLLFGTTCNPLEVDSENTLETTTGVLFIEASGVLFAPSILDVNPGTPMFKTFVPEEVLDKVVPNLGMIFIPGVLTEEILTSEVATPFGMASAELLINITCDAVLVQVAVVLVGIDTPEDEGLTRKTFWKVVWAGVLLSGRVLLCGVFIPHLETTFWTPRTFFVGIMTQSLILLVARVDDLLTNVLVEVLLRVKEVSVLFTKVDELG